MKKYWILFVLITGMLLGGCGQAEEASQPAGSGAVVSPEPFVVHVSPTESPIQDVAEKTEINWEEVLELTEEYLPDVEALKKVLPAPVSILQYDTGALRQNGVEDIVIVYEYPETVGCQLSYRTLAVFSGGDDYECLAFHDSLILDSESGGTFGDPFQYAEIADNGELHINFYGGSSWRWGYDLWFELLEEEFVLTRFVDAYSYTFSRDCVSVCYNFREQKTSCDAYWYMNEEEYGLLYEHPWKERIDFPRLSELKEVAWGLSLPDVEAPLPVFDTFYAHEDNRSRFTDFSAEEILDKVKEENYPEMEKVMYDTDEIFLEDISAFMGYQMPKYYYENEDGVKLYYRTAGYDADLGWEHEIGVMHDDGLEYILYREIE